ncbi:MAG: hypothetical protein RLZZ502_785 [Pseudomonadota bacterium]|jgi:predicted phosphate transport protein (TIGR00153 family)
MFSKMIPKEGNFFGFFNQHAELACKGAAELTALISNVEHDLDRHRAKIEQLEHEADEITHTCINLLHQTFITPIDRDQIHSLITTMDDILDLMEDVAQTVDLYDVHKLAPEAQGLAKICVDSCEKVKVAVALLKDMDDGAKILAICHDIDQLETDADHLMRKAIGRLFREEADAKEILKQKAIYELLETITDRCEDVANLIEGIVLENA